MRTRTRRTITARGIFTRACKRIGNATAFAALPARCIALSVGKLTDRLDRPIVLVGLMGAGKSTVGRRLAKRLGLPFNTYRYHLAKGIERIADWLWQCELNEVNL